MTDNLQDLKTKLLRVFDRVAAHANVLSVDNSIMDSKNAIAAAQAADALLKVGGLTDENLGDIRTKLYRVFDRVSAHADILSKDNTAMDAQMASASAQVASSLFDVEGEISKRTAAAQIANIRSIERRA